MLKSNSILDNSESYVHAFIYNHALDIYVYIFYRVDSKEIRIDSTNINYATDYQKKIVKDIQRNT